MTSRVNPNRVAREATRGGRLPITEAGLRRPLPFGAGELGDFLVADGTQHGRVAGRFLEEDRGRFVQHPRHIEPSLGERFTVLVG